MASYQIYYLNFSYVEKTDLQYTRLTVYQNKSEESHIFKNPPGYN